ncbi:hypothetical protein [Actinoplanes siamensis]|uniref:Uncharacterized protein n=1 Tax=Actinoplanes siamensis TaxID=1223317 RepID=A0A919TJW6_9ACTN|nr:hypothetical protein [Actinoplanes siamensis]GIF04764.1 hypothetical protein Asi03nite_23020 [Actinoplanes siamensis]
MRWALLPERGVMVQGGTAAAGAGDDKMPAAFWVAVAAVPLGVIFICCPYRISVLAPILVSLGLGALVYAGFLAMISDDADSGPPVFSRLLAVVAAVGAIAVVLSLGGLLTRWFDGNNYRGFYGDRVAATVPSPGDCKFTKGRRGVGGSNATCDGATWTVDGKKHTGKISVKGDDILGATGPITVDAYALGDRASSVARTDPEYDAARISGVPLWAGLAGLALLVASFAAQVVAARSRH